MGVVTRLISMGSLSVFGFIKGFQPIAGYSYGARKFDRLRSAVRTSILWSTVFCAVFGMLLALFLALGKGREGFILGACRQGICFIPVILILPRIWGLDGILYAQPIADVLSAVITIFMAISLHNGQKDF